MDDFDTDRGETRIFDMVHLDFSESCDYMECLLGDWVLHISFMILLTYGIPGRSGLCMSYSFFTLVYSVNHIITCPIN